MAQIAAHQPDVGFLEAHSENYFCIGGAPFEQLMAARALFPVSLHGVGLSLGSANGVDDAHVQKLKTLVDIVDPVLVSEHMTWSRAGRIAVPDLLPLPRTQEAVDALCRNIDHVQNTLGRAILVENPSSYMSFNGEEMSETDMMATLAQRTGAKILLDINNVYVSARNLGFDALAYLRALPLGSIGEMHLAGHQRAEETDLLIDAHNGPVAQDVWDLYAAALGRFGDTPTLVEWDRDIPPLATLVEQAHKANTYRARSLHANVA